jgi:hypothetical protein
MQAAPKQAALEVMRPAEVAEALLDEAWTVIHLEVVTAELA